MDLHVFPIPIPAPASLSIPSLGVFPVHQPRALVSCIQPGLVSCFTLDSILVSMLFSQNVPPLPSPTESKSLFCTSVSLTTLKEEIIINKTRGKDIKVFVKLPNTRKEVKHKRRPLGGKLTS